MTRAPKITTNGKLTELVAAKMTTLALDDSPLAPMALALAQQVDSGTTPPGALAGVIKQLQAVLHEAQEQTTTPAGDWIDALRERRKTPTD